MPSIQVNSSQCTCVSVANVGSFIVRNNLAMLSQPTELVVLNTFNPDSVYKESFHK